ncbi:hypothetical protein Dimus_017755 [Dionaea muscipula]
MRSFLGTFGGYDHPHQDNIGSGCFEGGAALTSKLICLPNDGFLQYRKLSPALTAQEKRENHNENERIRRKGFNGHIETFRRLFPSLTKKDKASVLGEVVRQVRELNKRAAKLRSAVGSSININEAEEEEERIIQGSCYAAGGVYADAAVGLLVPDDTDNVNVRRCDADSSIVIATLSCEDREKLIPDIIWALGSVKGRAIRAEMATVGCRAKTKLWVQLANSSTTEGGGLGGSAAEKDEALMGLQRALKQVVDKDDKTTCHLMTSKWQPPFYSSG